MGKHVATGRSLLASVRAASLQSVFQQRDGPVAGRGRVRPLALVLEGDAALQHCGGKAGLASVAKASWSTSLSS